MFEHFSFLNVSVFNAFTYNAYSISVSVQGEYYTCVVAVVDWSLGAIVFRLEKNECHQKRVRKEAAEEKREWKNEKN